MALIDFDTIRENWAEIHLPDGIILKMRQALVFLEDNGKDGSTFGIRAPLSAESYSPLPLRGDPTNEAFDSKTHKMERKYSPEEWISKSSAIGLYVTSDGRRLLLALNPTEIRRFAYFQKNREPFLQIDYLADMEISPPLLAPRDTLSEKFVAKAPDERPGAGTKPRA